ncbi:hypothetical protein N7466_008735 [Penicillium verhagenii]|uniref:uncharacterized protein n=1 Tax=Penicillium verhagenii TaxID=1562060 RepID=UPI002545912D|nr:uncharacterized protein N7466_008735 [Penicillium verhagenii]KAJ5924548.1 hypothetical protein N7466_008735 [Penicillium verhagenii]
MPPRRRAAAKAQSAISFGTQSRVTKPATTPVTQNKGKNLDATTLLKTEKAASVTPEPQHDVATEPSKPRITELAVRQPAQPKHIQTEEEKRALKLSLKDIQKHWREQSGRNSIRVHHEDVKLEEKVLRNFDLSSQYGPCIGMDRTQRWRRAQRLGLSPPIEVLAILLKGDLNEQSHMEELVS